MANKDKVVEVGTLDDVENSDKANVAILMMKVFGDRLNGLSEAEIAYVQEAMIGNLDKVKVEAKERAAWAEVLDGIKDVIVKHSKLDVVKGKGLRIMFNADGKVDGFNIYTPKGSASAGSTSGMVKQYRLKGSANPWTDTTTWAAACDKHEIKVNGASGKVRLETKFETRIVPATTAKVVEVK